MAKTSKTKRVYRKRAAKGKRMYRKRVNVNRGVPEKASLTEIINSASTTLSTNQAYQSYKISLALFPRASAVAKGYQLYRIKRATFKMSPLYDTFAEGGTTSVPYLYYMIDRTKNLISNNGLDVLKRMGAKPRRVDERVVSFSWSPSVLVGSLDVNPPVGQSTNQFTQYKISPWLNTRDSENLGVWNPDGTDHQGVVWYVETTTGQAIPYKMELQVEFEFKKPSFEVTPVVGNPDPIDVLDILSA